MESNCHQVKPAVSKWIQLFALARIGPTCFQWWQVGPSGFIYVQRALALGKRQAHDVGQFRLAVDDWSLELATVTLKMGTTGST